MSLATNLTHKIKLTFWWAHSEGLQCSFVFPSNVLGTCWILRSGWTVKNNCMKSKSFPENADHSWNPLTNYSGHLLHLSISNISLYKRLAKDPYIRTNKSQDFLYFQNLRNASIFPTSTFIKKGKIVTIPILTFNCIIWPHVFYINQISNKTT